MRDEEDFIRTPLSTNGFYRILPGGNRRWEEFVLCNEGQEHVREMHAKLLREAVVDAFHANGLIVSGTEVEMIVKAAIEVGK